MPERTHLLLPLPTATVPAQRHWSMLSWYFLSPLARVRRIWSLRSIWQGAQPNKLEDRLVFSTHCTAPQAGLPRDGVRFVSSSDLGEDRRKRRRRSLRMNLQHALTHIHICRKEERTLITQSACSCSLQPAAAVIQSGHFKKERTVITQPACSCSLQLQHFSWDLLTSIERTFCKCLEHRGHGTAKSESHVQRRVVSDRASFRHECWKSPSSNTHTAGEVVPY